MAKVPPSAPRLSPRDPGPPAPSPLHLRWHSSNVPGLGRQPQAPSSALPAAPGPVAAAPGVRSEPRPAPAPAPKPPPSGGSVNPGGAGGGGGSPTRAGAGGELAANTFPMAACNGGEVGGRRAKGEGQGRARRGPDTQQNPAWLRGSPGLTRGGSACSRPGQSSAPTPCATRNRTRYRRRRRGGPAPPRSLAQRASKPARRFRVCPCYWIRRHKSRPLLRSAFTIGP